MYSASSHAEDQDIQDFYDTLQKVIDRTAKADALVINAKVGDKGKIGILGKHGLGDHNLGGERLTGFSAEKNYVHNKHFPSVATKQTVYLDITVWTVVAKDGEAQHRKQNPTWRRLRK